MPIANFPYKYDICYTFRDSLWKSTVETNSKGISSYKLFPAYMITDVRPFVRLRHSSISWYIASISIDEFRNLLPVTEHSLDYVMDMTLGFIYNVNKQYNLNTTQIEITDDAKLGNMYSRMYRPLIGEKSLYEKYGKFKIKNDFPVLTISEEPIGWLQNLLGNLSGYINEVNNVYMRIKDYSNTTKLKDFILRSYGRNKNNTTERELLMHVILEVEKLKIMYNYWTRSENKNVSNSNTIQEHYKKIKKFSKPFTEIPESYTIYRDAVEEPIDLYRRIPEEDRGVLFIECEYIDERIIPNECSKYDIILIRTGNKCYKCIKISDIWKSGSIDLDGEIYTVRHPYYAVYEMDRENRILIPTLKFP
jgi:hypothetical protein